jgi:hypothetical protein
MIQTPHLLPTFVLHSSDAVKSFGNHPWCFPMSIFCRKKEVALFWSPVSGLSGHDVFTTQFGHENCCTRCWYGTFCGNNCCPKTKSTLLMGIKIGSVTLNAGEVSAFEPLRTKQNVRDFRRGLSQVESCLLNATDSFA